MEDTGQSEPILDAVRRALEADTDVRIEDPAIGLTDDGSLFLEGVVADISVKRTAANTARRALAGRRPLEDRLRVRARRGGELALRDEVLRNLAGESMFSEFTLDVHAGSDYELVHDGGPEASRINVHVNGSVVRLEGRVPSLDHQRFAEVLAWWAPTCERVDNRLEVASGQDEDDNEITDTVRMVLEKDPLVIASQIRPGTAGHVVELWGLVASDEERRVAVSDAWYVPGVWSVVDHIVVRLPNPA